ncbi:MAG: hypothetical protein HY586_03125, partial [Candidatus Omnitrophica bacterium]|nr:hypothetical protein [Candidatus Omnitrophota bacterium]
LAAAGAVAAAYFIACGPLLPGSWFGRRLIAARVRFKDEGERRVALTAMADLRKLVLSSRNRIAPGQSYLGALRTYEKWMTSVTYKSSSGERFSEYLLSAVKMARAGIDIDLIFGEIIRRTLDQGVASLDKVKQVFGDMAMLAESTEGNNSDPLWSLLGTALELSGPHDVNAASSVLDAAKSYLGLSVLAQPISKVERRKKLRFLIDSLFPHFVRIAKQEKSNKINALNRLIVLAGELNLGRSGDSHEYIGRLGDVHSVQECRELLRSASAASLGFIQLAEAAHAKNLISDSALENMRTWEGEAYRRVHEQLRGEFEAAGDDAQLWKQINDAWYTHKAPGTAGVRGMCGLGTNRINEYTLGIFHLAHARAVADSAYNAIIQAHDPEFNSAREKKAVVLGGDSRYGSYDPATKTPGQYLKLEALINAAHGIRVYLYRLPASTPQLAWSVHELKVDDGHVLVSGAMSTASHNPKSDNGNKPYKPDGSQSTGAFADLLKKKTKEVTADELSRLEYAGMNILDHVDAAYEEAVKKGDIVLIGGENDSYRADEQYIQSVIEEGIYLDQKHFAVGTESEPGPLDLRNAKIVISPLYGVARYILEKVLERRGLRSEQIIWVEDEPNPEFPGVKGGKPNPESSDARLVALRKAVEANADLVLWSDPDGDRPAVAVKKNPRASVTDIADYLSLNGNAQLALLADYMIRELSQMDSGYLTMRGVRASAYQHLAKLLGLPGLGIHKTWMASTVVSGDLMKIIGRANGVGVFETLVGFKYIGDLIQKFVKIAQSKVRIRERAWHTRSKANRLTNMLFRSLAFLLGGEESLGVLTSDGPHDKDAISGLTWFVEILGRLNRHGVSFLKRLEEIYKKYGYFSEKMLTTGVEYGG